MNGQQVAVPANKLLWRAPELLRKDNHQGTKEGDVYSFSIIVQEVVLVDTPFCDSQDTLEVEEIISKVKAGETPPFRPKILDDGLYSSSFSLNILPQTEVNIL